MLKYKMTVPHVQLKISKMFCFVLLMSLSFLFFFFFNVFCDTLERMQATSAHVCARILSVEKRKTQNNFFSPSNLKVKWRLVATHLPACQLSQIQYRNVSLFSLLSFSLSRLPTSPGDKSCMGTSLPHFRL